jgi:alpha,alpha-trehalase
MESLRLSNGSANVNRPTKRPLNEVLAAFQNLSRPIQNDTALNNFLTTYFGQAGSELEPLSTSELKTQPDFLTSVNSSIVANFTSQVIDIWPDLTRRYVGGGNCTGCESSFIPINRTFVVAGGRFREPYYWDSFWVIEGLLRTQGSFTQIAGTFAGLACMADIDLLQRTSSRTS